MEKTSRHYIIDLVELIANEIALASHYQELINSYDGDDVKEYHKLQEQLKNCIDKRRECMLELQKFGTKNARSDYRCIIKHSIASYIYATECYYSGRTKELLAIQQKTYESMMENLSIFLGLDEIVYCGRCITDKLLSSNNET